MNILYLQFFHGNRKRVFEYCGWIITHEGREVRPYPRNGNRGYPRGLIGNQIPYESKVLAIVTDYCAMRGERAYRPSLTKEEAINELRKKVGVRYDSDLVLEFIHMLESDIGGMHENK